ncbi:ras association domain-containing protein 6 isoform X1 [Poecilia latipinna]|nr:PREDICTED: ras association domain-containing protein 6-like isoform X1 [Poecilia formosa]XP_007561703.1 PREDICTED: ras association domain-containing protein 6-like isoform X1 [Poecilia formosa]XP_007561704.1 PREDICTED: ras association domain-containing protein 6-like isoform X1 [Poecilia formosa]XP_014890492.1 PREDICTED: ras association domain-containing protein 6-like isoform X1 [Poecilia latipinna]XP_014890493.1 PREDICTED: ras association domain-containing protein 6-like isoform X1 [Poecil
MNKAPLPAVIQAGSGRTLTRAEFLSLLNTYNCYLKDQTQLHLTYSQGHGGQVIVEGFLNISWGVRRPIRLKIQDEKQILPLESPTSVDPTSQNSTSTMSRWGEHSEVHQIKEPEAAQETVFTDPLPDPVSPISPLGSKSTMSRWGEYSELHQIDEMAETEAAQETVVKDPLPGPPVYETATLRPMRHRSHELEPESNLVRCMSDVSLVKRRKGRGKSAAQREKEKQHRFSINGHFYNYKTSIFTPSFDTSTKVRISSRMTTDQVIEQLLNKFKIENDPQEFALYCIHQSGEKKKLSHRDHPLWERILQGPSDDIMKIFLMDMHEEEVSNDVAQYLNLELPILDQFLLKLREEENREIQRVINKYQHQHRLLSHMLSFKMSPHIETSV